jgi:hypothetical protein
MRVKLALSVFFLAYTSADAQQQTSPAFEGFSVIETVTR